MLARLQQESNAISPILVTLSGMVYSVSPAGAKEFNTPSTIKQRPSSEAYLPLNSARLSQKENTCVSIEVTLSGMVTLARLEHSRNAPRTIEVTLSGMVTLARLEQLKNACSPISVTLSGMVTLARLEHSRNA